jgi:hypothetical protein
MRTTSPGVQAILGLDPPLVDTHLAALEQAIEMTARHTLEDAQQKIVDPLTLGLVIDPEILWRFRRIPTLKGRERMIGDA